MVVCKNTLLPKLVYPLVVTTGMCIYAVLNSLDIPAWLSAYITVVAVGFGVMIGLEKVLPYRESWEPNSDDAKNDVLFSGLTHIIIPKALALASLYGVGAYVQAHPDVQFYIWPREWSLIAQFLLYFFMVEFVRYWLHYVIHIWRHLWKFHAVHHSPHKMYWGNFGRYHPFEKVVHFSFDTLPFIIVGISQEVLVTYFVLHTLHAYVQHSNIDVRLGWFNRIISGPELHRWHHSKEIVESNTNFGNILSIWDVVFGSWHNPADKAVGDLGLLNRDYPLDFMRQMRTPFIKNAYKAKT